MHLIGHRGRTPTVDPSAYVAPTAVLCGEVRIGPRTRILFGAVITAEDGSVEIGARCIFMENALVRGRARHRSRVGDDALIGPHAHVNGAVVSDGAFLATGSSVFPGARLGRGTEVRINAVVQVNTVLEDHAVVPIGWVAVGIRQASSHHPNTNRSGRSKPRSTSPEPCTAPPGRPPHKSACNAKPTGTPPTSMTAPAAESNPTPTAPPPAAPRRASR